MRRDESGNPCVLILLGGRHEKQVERAAKYGHGWKPRPYPEHWPEELEFFTPLVAAATPERPPACLAPIPGPCYDRTLFVAGVA